VLVLVALPFVFYVSNSKSTRDHNLVDRVVVWLSAPVQWLTVAALDGVSGTWRRYIHLVGVQEENEALRARVAELEQAVQRREEYRLENERLRALADLQRRAPGARAVMAHVIATSPTPLFRSLRVDRGTGNGVHLGAAVVGKDGLVGRVAAVADGWADVMLLVDANNSLDVIVQRTRAHARVRGRGGDDVVGIDVEHLGRTEDVEPGDILITSGTGSVFPKGLRVGTIVSVERGRFGLYQEAAAEPSVDFGRIEEVMILPRGWPADASFERPPAAEEGERPADGDKATAAALETVEESVP
jgi:rod shape-determining protein MreC